MIALARQFKSLFHSLIVISLFTSVAFATSTEAPEDYRPRDTVFDEIVLTDEGVTAIDTAGHEWYYDFEYSTFVVGYPPPPEGDFDFDGISDIPIEERAVIRKRVKHFEKGDVTVRADEFVSGDITAWGLVTVKGWVKGDVVSVRDRVLITETAVIEGDVKAPKVLTKEGAIIGGSIIESENPLGDGGFPFEISHEFLLVMTIITLSFLFLGFIILAVMPRQVANIQSCILQNKARCFTMGFLIVLVVPAIIVLLAITIIGVVLIPILPFVYFWGILLGIVATGKSLGEFVQRKFFGGKLNQILIGIVGIVVLMFPWIMTGALLGNSDETAIGFGVFFLILSIIISLFPIFTGLGAAFLTRFGFRTYVTGSPFGPKSGRPTAPSPAPPPIPDSPFVQKPETPDSETRISEENRDS